MTFATGRRKDSSAEASIGFGNLAFLYLFRHNTRARAHAHTLAQAFMFLLSSSRLISSFHCTVIRSIPRCIVGCRVLSDETFTNSCKTTQRKKEVETTILGSGPDLYTLRNRSKSRNEIAQDSTQPEKENILFRNFQSSLTLHRSTIRAPPLPNSSLLFQSSNHTRRHRHTHQLGSP